MVSFYKTNLSTCVWQLGVIASNALGLGVNAVRLCVLKPTQNYERHPPFQAPSVASVVLATQQLHVTRSWEMPLPQLLELTGLGEDVCYSFERTWADYGPGITHPANKGLGCLC